MAQEHTTPAGTTPAATTPPGTTPADDGMMKPVVARTVGSTGGGETGVAASPTPPMTTGGCTEFSVSFALLTSDNNRQISFGVTRGCIDARTPLYVISFLLRDRVGDDFHDRVRLLVTVGPESHGQAQAIIDRGLRSTQKNFLEGTIATRAATAPPGTTEKTPQGAALAEHTSRVFNE